MYTVKELADLAGITARTLHHYDDIGLLHPSKVGANGYRYYDEGAVMRLQQVLLYREMDIGLQQIKQILDNPDFDLVSALQSHHRDLIKKLSRLQTLIKTVDTTILHLTGEQKMSDNKIFEGFSDEQQKEYEEQARQQWGDENVQRSVKLWNSYSDEERKRIKAEGGEIYQGLAAKMGQGPKHPEVQALLGQWHQHLRYFYEPSFEVLRGLGNGYNEDPSFRANLAAIDPGLPEFLQQAISVYVDQLEEEWLERELGQLEE